MSFKAKPFPGRFYFRDKAEQLLERAFCAGRLRATKIETRRAMLALTLSAYPSASQ
jgi:hypothetical protein